MRAQFVDTVPFAQISNPPGNGAVTHAAGDYRLLTGGVFRVFFSFDGIQFPGSQRTPQERVVFHQGQVAIVGVGFHRLERVTGQVVSLGLVYFGPVELKPTFRGLAGKK